MVDLLVSMGYRGSKIENSQVLGKSGDEGIDVVIKEDKLGFDKIYRHKGTVLVCCNHL